MKKTILILLCLFWYVHNATAQDKHVVMGEVVQANEKEPLPGATVSIKGGKTGTVTDRDGKFVLSLTQERAVLVVNFIGFQQWEKEVSLPFEGNLIIELLEDDTFLQEVEVVSTGYETLPKERATGAFVFHDEEILNRRVGNNIIDRLEDITPGLIFNRAGGEQDPISIRGRSTIHANTRPLIVIDNFPYDGPLENINPNDVESISILKDAAAASIWGARAGNGVIVITTKKGGFNQKLKVSLNANTTILDRPNPFYLPTMTPSEFIEVEQILFGRGFYNNMENAVDNGPLTPVVEDLIAHRDGILSESELTARLQAYGKNDVRNDLGRYIYQSSMQQQYALNLTGGGQNNRFSFSSGYDRNNTSLVGNLDERFSLQGQNSWSLLNNKLNVSSGIYLVQQNRGEYNNGPNDINFRSNFPIYPYARLADDAGNPLQLTRDYRRSFADAAKENGLLDWSYFPLNDLWLSGTGSKATDIRVNTAINYRLTTDLTGEVLYQYWQNQSESNQLHEKESYYARNLINQYTQFDGGQLSYPIPLGAILVRNGGFSSSHNLRAQLRYNKSFKDIHNISAFGGYEIKSLNTVGNQNTFYGYNPELAISQPVDFISQFPQYHNPGLRNSIPSGISHRDLTDRFISYFVNGAYSYKNRYTASISARKDQSNLFGVAANQRGVPLWSAGGSWILSNESWFQRNPLSLLKIRGTFGYNGNIDKSLTAEVTSRVLTGGAFGLNPGLPYAMIDNPPNPDLRWERIKTWNAGVDFELKGGRVWGTMDFFYKEGIDLMGDTPLAPSTGLLQFRGNSANTLTRGIDLILNTDNLRGPLSWRTVYLFNHNKEEVTQYFFNTSAIEYLTRGGGVSGWPVPWEGRPLFSIYSYAWAGLDPDTGNPRGYLDGEPSTNYAAVVNNTALEDLIYHGPARPTVFGSIRNDFEWNNFSLSINVSYRLGYFYRRNSVLYNPILSARVGHADFSKRWTEPGDEEFTNVPSMPISPNLHRDNIYRFSEINVERGDHVRLQDIRLGYTLRKENHPRLPFGRAEIYSYANNLGILWKASKDPLDPDFPNGMPPLRSIAFGARIDF